MSAAAAIVVGPRMQVLPHGAAPFDATGKAALLLALAALEGTAERRRAALLLWPDSPERQARNNLRTLVHRLNQRCGVELLLGTEQLGFDPARARVVTQDTEVLLAALDAGGPQACELLAQAGVDGHGSEALGAWLDAARQRWRRQQLAALSEALHAALAADRTASAITLARACVQLEPLSEHWHRQLMDTLARCGDRAAALAAFEDCKQRLRQLLGVLPDEQTRTVQLRILQGQAQAAAAPPQSVAVGLSPLGGAARFPLVEREAVLAEARSALGRGQHVALQGEAGVGKTRLLRHLADPGEAEQVAIRPGARDAPYAAITQWLQEVQPRRALRIGSAEQAELARLAPHAFPGTQPAQAGLTASLLHEALRHWTQQLHAAGVRCLVLDDLHHADAASQAALGALLARPEGDAPPAPALLLAHRSGEIGAALAEALVAAQVRGQASCLTLQRLSLHGVQQLLESMQAAQARELAPQLLQRTGGNPLFVIELAQQTLENAEAITAASGNMDALLRSRLAGCSAEAQQLASVAAVAASDFSVEVAAAVTGQAPLALMPAWSELQQRGLFADHGIAHDLVRDAALGAMPQPILRSLHAQVAAHLEAQGLHGARVLRHWLAAGHCDHALPHAMHQLYATSAAGLSTERVEMELLGLLERLSGPVLLDNLWLSAEIQGRFQTDFRHVDVWPRMEALVARVGQLAGDDPRVAQWMGYESARVLFRRDRASRQAYDSLLRVTQAMPPCGPERARAELFLALLANNLNGRQAEHAGRAKNAVRDLPRTPCNARLLNYVETVGALVSSALVLIRDTATSMRQARRAGDMAAAFRARRRIAMAFATSGRPRAADRHLTVAVQQQAAIDTPLDVTGEPVVEGMMALSTGRYAVAKACFLRLDRAEMASLRALFLTQLALRLGQWGPARALFDGVEAQDLRHQFLLLHLHALLRSELDRIEGGDTTPALHDALAAMDARGMQGTNRLIMEWELMRRTMPAPACLEAGGALVAALRGPPSLPRLPHVLLEVAEVHVQAGSPEGPALARAAARGLRRGDTTLTLYLPEGLVRCANLLEASDPAEAAALRHVARRWVRQALQHVPDDARADFLTRIPVNRLLLDGPA
ncbi:BTAD domain-containing putative transcriptional regulator [Rubrivivax sp. RP6-9]|uniref:BTAD domain-containing putative transcriptional regulator n=1 Tax=Rubrivivax sp. RP6-9 TaxID=3415750 RepID=UPI003CC5682C